MFTSTHGRAIGGGTQPEAPRARGRIIGDATFVCRVILETMSSMTLEFRPIDRWQSVAATAAYSDRTPSSIGRLECLFGAGSGEGGRAP